MHPSLVSVSISATGTAQSAIATPSVAVNLASVHHEKPAILSEQEKQAMIDGAASAKNPGSVNIKHGGYIDGTVGPPTAQPGIPEDPDQVETHALSDAEEIDPRWYRYMELIDRAVLEGELSGNRMVNLVFDDRQTLRLEYENGHTVRLKLGDNSLQRRDAEGAAPGAAANASPGRGHWTENLSAEEVREVMAQMEERGSAGKDGGEGNVEVTADGVAANSVGVTAGYIADYDKANEEAAVLAKRGDIEPRGDPMDAFKVVANAWLRGDTIAARDLTATSDSHVEDDDVQAAVLAKRGQAIMDFAGAMKDLADPVIGHIVETAENVEGTWFQPIDITPRDLTATSDSHAEEDDGRASVLAKRFDAFPFGKALHAMKKAWWDDPRSRTRGGRRLTRRYGSRALAARDITTSPAAAAHDSHAQDAADVQASAIIKRDNFAQGSRALAQKVVDRVENAPARPKPGVEAERAERLKEAKRKEDEAAREEEKGSSVARRAASGLDAATSAAGAKGLSVRGAFVAAFLASTFFLTI